MKIIYTFLLALGMVMAPGLGLGAQVLTECALKIVKYSYNLSCVNRASKQICDAYFQSNTTIKVKDDHNLGSWEDDVLETLFGSSTVSSIADLSPDITSGIYKLDELPDVDIPVNTHAEDIVTNLIDDEDMQVNLDPPNSIRSLTINLKISPYSTFDNIEYPYEFMFEFREPGTYKLKDLLLAMATLTKNIHQMVHKHNRVLDINQLDKANPGWLARMQYDCATIGYTMMKNVRNIGFCLKSNIIGLKLRLSMICSKKYDFSTLYTDLDKLCIHDDMDSGFDTVASFKRHQENQAFTAEAFQIFNTILCRQLGYRGYPCILPIESD
jgi:hypothetical protein